MAARGGKREGAGRKVLPSNERKQSFTIRLDAALQGFINVLRSEHKKQPLTDEVLQRLSGVLVGEHEQTSALSEDDIKEQVELIERLTTQNVEFEARLNQAVKANQPIVQERDGLQLEKIQAKSKIIRLENDLKNHVDVLERMRHKEHDCQCLTEKGERCKRPAKLKVIWQGVELNVCLQHQKKLNIE